MASRTTERDRHLARTRLLELLVELLADSPTDDDATTTSPTLPGKIRATLDQIAHTPVDSAPSVRDTLEQMGYSYAHLCRCFRNAYGLPPLQYVNALRTERTKLLIRDTSVSVSEVARQAGCDSPACFCRLFRKHTDMSPTQYRARNGGWPIDGE